MKTTLPTIFLRLSTLLCFIILLCYPSQTLEGASVGLLLWFQTILPTLLPIMILADFILRIGGDRYLTKLVAGPLSLIFGLSENGCYGALVGLLCGYPMGAKTTASLLKENRISRQEANYLLAFSNQPSAMFLIGYLCLSLFADYDGNTLVFPLLFGVYGSAVLISIFYRGIETMHHVLSNSWQDNLSAEPQPNIPISPSTHNKSADSSPLSLLESSMMTSFEVMVKIGGYMMLFSIAEVHIGKVPLVNATVKSMLMGIIEMTTGCRHVATVIQLPWALALCGAVTTFGGLSGLAQTSHVLQGSGLSMGRYVLWKLLQGILAGILILLCCYP
ncbi:MAG: hypothetical protein IKT45_06945 [Lachnospiraceae bacterium]|nr:hypothetical protein [Lachnospiraceae bacterium]